MLYKGRFPLQPYRRKTYRISLFLFSFATRAGSPQQREPITVGPNPPVNFPCGSTREKATTFSRTLTMFFSHKDWPTLRWTHKDWVRAYIKMNLTGDWTLNLRGERRVVWPLHHQRTNDMDKIECATFRYDTAEVKNELKHIVVYLIIRTQML